MTCLSLCRMWAISSFIIAASLTYLPAYASSAPASKTVVGYLEKAVILNIDQAFEAKLDTGADTTSIHAEVIALHKPEEGSEDEDPGYVVFAIQSDSGQSNHIKKPLKRIVKIISRKGGHIERPVVEMRFCIAGKIILEEVNLANRERFAYDVLVGRNMLRKAGLVVDSSVSYTTKPNCPETKEDSDYES